MFLSLMLFLLMIVPMSSPFLASNIYLTESKTIKSLSSTINADSELVNWVGRYNFDTVEETMWFSYSLSGFVINANCTSLSIDAVAKTSDEDTWVPILAVIVDEDYDNIHYVQIDKNYRDYENYILINNLEKKEHTFRVLKRTEAGYTLIGIKNITTDGAFVKNTIKKDKSILFIGDHLGLGDYTEGYSKDDDTPLSSLTTNPINSYWFIASQILNANYSFVGARAFPVYKTIYLDKNFKLTSIQQLAETSNFYIDVNKDNKTIWDFNKFIPDVVVMNVGFPDHSMYAKLDRDEKPYFIWEFRYALTELVNFIIDRFPNCKLLFMDGMVYTEQKIRDVITEVADSFKDRAFRFSSKSMSIKEEMIHNMPTLNMQKYAGNELAEQITNILEGKTSSKTDIYNIISFFAVIFVGFLIPTAYLFIDKKIRGKKS